MEEKEKKEKKTIKISLGAATVIALVAIVTVIALVATIVILATRKNNDSTNAKVNNSATSTTSTTNNTLSNKNTVEENNTATNTSNLNNTTNTSVSSNTTTNSTSANTENVNNDGNYFIMYDGYEMKATTGVQALEDMKYTKENQKKYNTKYYTYQKSKYIGEKESKIEITYGGNTEENSVGIVTDLLDKVAVTKKYEAIPRTIKRETKLPEELKDMADYPSVTVDTVDLDGDGKEEHIVSWRVSYKKGEIGDGKPQESSGMSLYDSNYKKVADLAELKNGFWGNFVENNQEESALKEYRKYLDLDQNEYIDIDNDGVMEILVRIPTYEGTVVSVVKYNKGTYSGEKNVQASVAGGRF